MSRVGGVITEPGTGFRLWIADRRIGKTADGRLTDDMSIAQTLVCGTYGSMPLDDAIKWGFVSTSDIREADIQEREQSASDSELTDGYMYNGEREPFPNGYKSR